ncbi:hypothetical protein HDU67_003156 [Dinochytrium kinnereticum]|nr:hypothetical protein HDU67_003156 [Dinochytrium kinnereticum]
MSSSYINDFLSAENQTNHAFRSRLRKECIDLENANRKLFAQQRDALEIQDPYATLLPVHSDKSNLWNTLPLLEEENATPVILKLEAKNRRLAGTSAIVDKKNFLINWKLFTEGSLQYLNWDNVFAAGGSVLSCLQPLPEAATMNLSERRQYLRTEFPASDIDLFIYGLDENQAKVKMQEIFQSVVESVPYEVLAFRTPNAISIISQHPFRHIQVVLRLYQSPAEVLTGFDVDCCTVGFDGKDVWSTRRGHFAIITQCNIIDITRRSPSYESRLAKYSERGFEIRVPELDRSKIDPQLYDRSFEKTRGLARLLLFEALRTQEERLTYKENQRERKMRPPHKNAGQYLQYSYHRNNDLKSQGVDSRASMDCQENSKTSSQERLPAQSSTRHHQHPLFYGTMDDVLGDCCGACPTRPEELEEEERKLYVSGSLQFIVDNPGRQEIGSFHPLTEDDWTDGAYVPDNAVELIQAIVKDDDEALKMICNQASVDLNSRDWMGRTPLLLATLCNAIKCVSYLLSENVQLALTLPDGRNPLHICAEHGFTEIGRLLLKKSTENKLLIDDNANKKKPVDIEPSVIASLDSFIHIRANETDEWDPERSVPEIENSEDDSLDYIDLSTTEWDFNMTPLHFAILYGNDDFCRILLTAGADAKKRLQINSQNSYQSPSQITALRLASLCVDRKKMEKVLRVLLFDFKLSLSQMNFIERQSFVSVLHLAVMDNKLVPGRAAELLELYFRLAQPSDVKAWINSMNNKYESPTALACRIGCVSALRVLIANGAEVSYSLEECEKAIARFEKNLNYSFLARRFNNSAAEMLNIIEHPAAIAINNGNHECLRLLIEKDPDVLNNKDSLMDTLQRKILQQKEYVISRRRTVEDLLKAAETLKKKAENSNEDGWRGFLNSLITSRMTVPRYSIVDPLPHTIEEMLMNDSDEAPNITDLETHPKAMLLKEERALRRFKLCEDILSRMGAKPTYVVPEPQQLPETAPNESLPRFTILSQSNFGLLPHPSKLEKYTELFSAAWEGNHEKITELARSGPHADRLLVTCHYDSITPLMVAFLRGHYETAQVIFKIALEQRKNPKVKLSTKGANAHMNNFEVMGMHNYGEESEDEYEDYDDKESEDGDNQHNEEENDTEDENPAKSDFSLVQYLEIKTSLPLTSIKLAVSKIPNGLKDVGQWHSVSTFDCSSLGGGDLGLTQFLEMARTAFLVEKGFTLEAHEAGAKVSDAEVEKIKTFIKNPTTSRVIKELSKSMGHHVVDVVKYDDVNIFDFLMRESLCNIDVADYLPELHIEDINIGPETVMVKKPKYSDGLSPPSMREKPLDTSFTSIKSSLQTILHTAATYGSCGIIGKLLSEGYLESILICYHENQPKDDPLANLLRRPDLSLGLLAKRMLSIENIPESKNFVHNSSPLHNAVLSNQPDVIKAFSDFLPADVKERWSLEITDVNGMLPIHTAAEGGKLECAKALLSGFDMTRLILSVDTKRAWNPIHFAVRHGRSDVAKLLIDSCPIECISDLLSAKSKLHQQTPLMVAANFAQSSTVKMLQEAMNSANVTKGSDVWGVSSLHSAVRSLNVTKTELGLGFDLEALNREDHAGLTITETLSQKLRLKLKSHELPEAIERKSSLMDVNEEDRDLVSYEKVQELLKTVVSRMRPARQVFPMNAAQTAANAAIHLVKNWDAPGLDR